MLTKTDRHANLNQFKKHIVEMCRYVGHRNVCPGFSVVCCCQTPNISENICNRNE